MQGIDTRFGHIEIAPEDLVTFDDGLIGFATLRRFVLISHNPDSPFRWLQSIDEPALAFLVVDPGCYVDGYSAEIDDDLACELGLAHESQALVYTTASIPVGRPRDMTINLAAPIVVSGTSRRGKQIVLENEAYTMKHRVFVEEAQTVESSAA